MYKVNRAKLIEKYPDIVSGLAHINRIKKDIILGGEFILDAQEILDNIILVDGSVLEPPLTSHVKSESCEIIFKHEV